MTLEQRKKLQFLGGLLCSWPYPQPYRRQTMSPRAATTARRNNKTHPNKRNLKKRLKQIEENVRILQKLAEEDA